MIILISPTKQMDFSSNIPEDLIPRNEELQHTPVFDSHAFELNHILRNYSVDNLRTLMKISPSLADDTCRRVHKFGSPDNPRKSALFTYSGTVFQEIDPFSFNREALLFTRKHLRILSGLYGILNPLDTIQPYRLEMKTPLSIVGERGGLISFWKDKVSEQLRHQQILNLASGEYSRILDKKVLKDQVLNFSFKEEKEGCLRTVGTYAKKARGQMIRRILMEGITDPSELRQGDNGGYRFRDIESCPEHWVFVRSA